MRRFELDVSDVDRGVYETVDLRAAQHPSETDAYLVTRVLAFALEWREALTFGKGLGDPEEPAVWERDATGRVRLWVDVGTPAPDRLHKASKAADEIAVYCHKRADQLAAQLTGQGIHQAERVRLVGMPRALLTALEEELDRKNAWGVLRTEGRLYVTVGPRTHEGDLDFHTLS